MFDFLLGTHEFLGNHSFPEFIVGYLFGAALIIGAPTVFLRLVTLCLHFIWYWCLYTAIPCTWVNARRKTQKETFETSRLMH